MASTAGLSEPGVAELAEARALIHQLAKDLVCIRHFASRLERSSGARAKDAGAIRSIAEEARRQLSTFLTGCGKGRTKDRLVPLARLTARAVRCIDRLHGAGRVSSDVGLSARGRLVDRRLEIVIVNLLDNALRASATDEIVKLEVDLDRTIRLRVVDAGVGMDQRVRESCCTPGFTTRRDLGGHGVGLAVVKQLVEDMGASLQISSRPGEGTVVIVAGVFARTIEAMCESQERGGIGAQLTSSRR